MRLPSFPCGESLPFIRLPRAKGANMKTPELAGDIIAGASAFAGLIIIYVGSVATAYSGYRREEQRSVRAKFRRRATIGAVGVGLAASSAGLALCGKWASSNLLVGSAAILMLVTLLWGVGVTVASVLEIR
jgi:hypothetical protein